MSARQERDGSHAFCLSRGEVILAIAVLGVGVSVSSLHELMFGGAARRVFSTAIDAVQGGLFWSAILIGVWRLCIASYRWLRRGVEEPGA